jgi:hypothetical protein
MRSARFVDPDAFCGIPVPYEWTMNPQQKLAIGRRGLHHRVPYPGARRRTSGKRSVHGDSVVIDRIGPHAVVEGQLHDGFNNMRLLADECLKGRLTQRCLNHPARVASGQIRTAAKNAIFVFQLIRF